MIQFSYYMFLKSGKKDFIIESKMLEEYYKKNKRRIPKLYRKKIENILEGFPMEAKVIDSTMKAVLDNIDYIEIMSNTKFFMIDYENEVY